MEKLNNVHFGEMSKWLLNQTKLITNDKEVGVYCPCCNNQFVEFCNYLFIDYEHSPDFFKNSRLDVICPICESAPRHRIICTILEDESENKKFCYSNVLLIAPNIGIRTWFNRNKIKYLTGDLHDKNADIRIDIQKTNLESNSFSFVSCDHVLEHVINWKMALKELHRIIQPDGYIEITVPLLDIYDTTFEDSSIVTAIDKKNLYGQYDHLRIFGRDFKERLKDAGFFVEVHDGNVFDSRIMPITAPATYDSNKIYICKKL